jgi:hypothetical protein
VLPGCPLFAALGSALDAKLQSRFSGTQTEELVTMKMSFLLGVFLGLSGTHYLHAGEEPTEKMAPPSAVAAEPEMVTGLQACFRLQDCNSRIAAAG